MSDATESTISNSTTSLRRQAEKSMESIASGEGNSSVGVSQSEVQQIDRLKATLHYSFKSHSSKADTSKTSRNSTIKSKTSTSSYTDPTTSKSKRFYKKEKAITDVCGAGLSSAQMREKLFASFRSKGVLESAKTQLRANLASVINESAKIQKAQKSKPESLFAKLSDILVAEHLKQAKYDYTLSIFKSESSASELDIIPSEILKIMRINPSTKKYDDLFLLLSQNDTKSFLWNFISNACGDNSIYLSVACQTDDCETVKETYIGKNLSKISEELDVSYKNEFFHRSLSLEERLFQLQKKLEDQKKKELKLEKERLKDTFVREIKLQERERNKTDVDRFKNEIEKSYKELIDSVKQREIEVNDMLVKKQKQIEQELYERRQDMLKEIEKLKEREYENKRACDIAMQTIKVEEAKLKTLEEQLRAKELSLQSLEEQHKNKLKEEILRIKIESQEEKQKFESLLRSQEVKLQEEKVLFECEKESVLNSKASLTNLNHEKIQLQASLNAALKKISILTYKSEGLKEKLQEFSDYLQIKELSVARKKEIDCLKTRVNEVMKEKQSIVEQNRKQVKELMESMLKGNPQTVQIQRQIEIDRNGFIEKEADLKEKISRIEQRLRSEISRNNELTHMNEAYLLENKALRRDIEELRAANKINAVSHDWHASKIKETEKLGESEKPIFNTNVTDRYRKSFEFVTPEHADEIDLCTTSSLMSRPLVTQGNRDIIAKLESEASALEDTYRNYQRKESMRNPSSYGVPHTNDYKPLQEYYSVVKHNEVQPSESAKFKPTKHQQGGNAATVTEQYDIRTSSSALTAAHNDALFHTKSSEAEGKFLSLDTKDVKRNTKGEKLQDTWNGDHLTEQLLESAVIQRDEGLAETKIASGAEAFSCLGTREVVNAEIPRFLLHNDVVSEEHQEDNRDFAIKSSCSSSLRSHKSEGLRQDKSENSEANVTSHDLIEDLYRKENMEMENLSSLSSAKETARKAATADNVDGDDVSDTFINNKENRRETLAGSSYETSNEKETRIDEEENSIHVEKMDSTQEKVLENDDVEEGDDENQIDPLMKHYMEMLSRKKQEENLDNGEPEQLNLTDDIKLESKVSKSEVSDLLEDEIEEIEQDPVDEFDW
ncbi:centriole and centriolar satellite protein ofd1-like [Rhopilema esculentum]|uniref:centriole and centriolar satellite protein ofd1-like n=1 Tax=Rhopilema esculentum TaxID=499914 RepID=UPI0031DCE376|eukprot:gene14552-5622_t